MTTARDIADAVGRKRLADTLGVGETAVSNAVVRGWFPSAWFLVVKDLADGAAVDCPPALFKMRLAGSQNVDSGAHVQVAPAGDAA